MNSSDMNGMFDSIPYANITSGFFIGLAVGYFLKKSLKIVLFLFGLTAIVIFYLQNQDMIHVNNDALLTGTDKFIALLKNIYGFAKDKLSFLQVSGGVGAVSGFFVGLKYG